MEYQSIVEKNLEIFWTEQFVREYNMPLS